MSEGKEEEFIPPIDTTFAEDMVREAAAKHLNEGYMGTSIETNWSSSWFSGGRNGNAFSVRLERDLSRIDVQVDLGNVPMRHADAKRGMRLALKHFPDAARTVMEARSNLKIHAATAALIAISRDENGTGGWNSVRDHLEFPISRRAASTINPYGADHKIDGDKLEWRLPHRANERMRLPGKRILPPDFHLPQGIRATNDRVHIPQQVPEALLLAKKGRPIHELVSIPGFEHVYTRITGWRKWGDGVHVSISSPTINMEEAFALMAKIIDERA